MTDVLAAKELVDKGEISEVRSIESSWNVVDDLAKCKKYDALNRVLDIGILNNKVEQGIEELTATTRNTTMLAAYHKQRASNVTEETPDMDTL